MFLDMLLLACGYCIILCIVYAYLQLLVNCMHENRGLFNPASVISVAVSDPCVLFKHRNCNWSLNHSVTLCY